MAKYGRKQISSNIGFGFAENADLNISGIGYLEIRSAYRMEMENHCLFHGICKRNCRNNPRCLSNIGEKVWFDDEEEEEEYEIENELLRSDGIPAGLRNLGNTCYVNSFLQIWFHNSKFRQALYEWDPGEDPEEQDNESILDPELYEPKSKVASLQALFAMMQYTKRKYADPTDFICKLGLNPSVQQDAQEFSKLFVSLLENSLAHQTNSDIKSMIQRLFRGEYAYVTKCLTCNRESIRPSFFYELDLALAGNKTLTIEKCLEDFLKIEQMTGDEKYFCEGCEAKQDATRCCKLRELPPVLNLQLNRFQYDMQFGRKKKLNSCILYPEELDMSKYLEGAEKGSCRYSLTGVLMHVGPDANHGHYIAHIQELETGNWFKFSDEHVVSLERKNMAHSNDKGLKKMKSFEKPTGLQNSNNAYMLVYMLKSSIEEIRRHELREMVKRDSVRRITIQKRHANHAREQALQLGDISGLDSDSGERRGLKRKPSVDSTDSIEEIDYSDEYCYSNCRVFPVKYQPHLRNKIDKDNLEFDEEIEEKKQRRIDIIRMNNKKKQRMKEMYKALQWVPEYNGSDSDESMDDESFEFVPKNWLMAWLADPLSVGPVETKHYLCVHENLDIDRLSDMKLCDSAGVNMLISEYGEGEGPRLNGDHLCATCVKNKARLISLDYKLQRDQEFLRHQLKVPTDGKGFWIGKKSLTNWKRLAKDALEDQIVREVQDWNLNRDCVQDFNCDKTPKKEYSKMHQDHEHSPDHKPGPNLQLSGLKAKLERMGTNVSVAPGVANNKLRNGVEGSSGISVIRNGESFKLANIAEVKLNFEDTVRVRPKPSCVVKPIVKPVQVKPSATVRPLNIQEALLKEKEENEELNGIPSADNSLHIEDSLQVVPGALEPDHKPNINEIISISDSESKHGPDLVKESMQTSQEPAETAAEKSPETSEKSTTDDSTSLELPEIETKVNPDPGMPVTSKPHTNGTISDTEDQFNSDIVCPHGNLRIEERCKQLISREVWFKLCSYFHNPKTFQFGIKPCARCREEEGLACVQRERLREEASRQKSKLSDLFANTDRPKWSKPTTKLVYLLSSNFVLAWRGFVRGLSAGKTDLGESITDINNSVLLCSHNGLLHVPLVNWENEPDPDVVMINEDEWRVVQELFNVDVEIKVDRENTPTGPLLHPSPSPCQICVKSRVEAEQESRLNYSNEIMFVTFLTQDEEIPNGDHDDPEFSSMSGHGLKMCGGGGYGVRRSTRRRKGRGEKEFVVNSDTLLRDLKCQIMDAFKVAPYDQILFLDGEYLRDNSQSLGSLGVLPGSEIFLKADNSVPCPPEDWTNPHPEQGFKGTGLLSS